MPRYRPVDPKADFPALERGVLGFWRSEDVFQQSLARRRGAPEWVFYEGPPTANGAPGIHHMEARTFKDVFPRFKTMTGHFVPRKGGWDCHGLPVEVQVEKEIGTRSKRDIEAFGVAEFIRLCRESVTRHIEDFERATERLGFWIDTGDAYFTMSPEYVQSVWWALKRLHELGMLYRDDKVTWYCPRCGTGLSDAEVAMGYQQVVDPSVYLRFPVTGGDARLQDAAFVGWTTTPWTLISNLGLAVDPREPYVRVSSSLGDLVVAEARLDALREVLTEAGAAEEVSQTDRFAGSILLDARYEPPYPNVDGDTHRVVEAGFVSMHDGTGIVHMAPAFGAEDLEVGRRHGWPVFNPVDEEGRFTDLAPAFVRGRFVKDADPDITEDLRSRGLLVRAGTIEHTYPLCWRCDTTLLSYARPAWYVRTTARKEDLLATNEEVNWYPEHIKHGRYGDWLQNNIDWSLSRERYWGTPLPVWLCADAHVTVVGSLAELSELAGRDVTGLDPHRPAVDEVTIACPTCGGVARRVTEVIDAWFDSGAMPFAQWGYMGPDSPGAAMVTERFPADFIAEAIDQTRGWFYTLMAEAVMLFDSTAYRNVVCLGLLVDREGRKMSKRLDNGVDPMEVMERYGADALRWFMLSSGSPWSDRRVFMEAFADIVRRFLLTLWNTYAFFVTYANIDEPDLAAAPPPAERPPIDRWALSRLNGLVAAVREDMERYDATAATRRIATFVEDMSNWYVRRSRRRFWDPSRAASASVAGADDAGDKLAAYATLHECLATLVLLLAPFTPFITEEIHRNLKAGASAPDHDGHAPVPASVSVHLADYPEPRMDLIDPAGDEAMEVVRTLVSLGRTVRSDLKVRVRQPLAHASIHVTGSLDRLVPLLPLVAEELNVKQVTFAGTAEELAGWRAKPNFRALGPRLGRRVQEVAEALARDDGSLAATFAAGGEALVGLPSGTITLTGDDVELSQQTRAGWGLASDGALAVALDLALTDELRREGSARELIHHVQALRRRAGLDVTDRIHLGIRTPPDGPVAGAVAADRRQIADEVLATELIEGTLTDATATAEADVDGEPVTLSLRRA